MSALEAFRDLEETVADAEMSGKLAQFAVEHMFRDLPTGEGSHAIHEITRWEAELLQFAIDEVHRKLVQLLEEFYVAVALTGPPTASGEPESAVSRQVNEIFAACIAAKAAQRPLIGTDRRHEAEALGDRAAVLRAQLRAIRDRSGNADLVAARVMLDLMFEVAWTEMPDIEWEPKHRSEALPLLEVLSDRLTGEVRVQARAALASVGIRIDRGGSASGRAAEGRETRV